MGEIIQLNDYRPHWVGDALCKSCRHKWVAVIMVGSSPKLECPKCGGMHGKMQRFHKPSYFYPKDK